MPSAAASDQLSNVVSAGGFRWGILISRPASALPAASGAKHACPGGLRQWEGRDATRRLAVGRQPY
ncbi:uncharacterized protein ColSpa_12272 [Colletotrichum spaethianum]|uniref:Uncharacterized protein n=1 Tax=Colletotrichum spaethianum TaxID=700344 RepID=A0AA37PGW2_9PEZI|nr:uncharacterized protein ColSpa_12272 [Colletotrichum spaethianum]GKT52091.1 hypothetical protein ColSpa_12272 [Colletotrichum spaethianum]